MLWRPRPITAQHSYMLAQISCELAKVSQPYVDKIDGISKESKAVVERMQRFRAAEEVTFSKYGREAFYPIIDIVDAFNVVQQNILPLNSGNGTWAEVPAVPVNNNFITGNGNIFHQRIGRATAIKVSPPFKKLYLFYKFEKRLKDKSILFQYRLLEDSLLFVKNEMDADHILKCLNDCSNLKYT